MAPTYEFNTPEGQKIDRSKLVACMNTASKDAPVWSIVGIGVSSSQTDMDWKRESETDITGRVTNRMSKPTVTQSFDPWPLAAGDPALRFVWEKGIMDEDAQALCNVDMLIVHMYAGTAGSAVLGVRYESCSVEVNSFGGDGGANIAMPITVTYGGTRTKGSVSGSKGKFVFTPDAE